MKKLNLIFIGLCIALSAQAQVLCKWDAESSRSAPARFDCYRGETLLFAPTYRQYGQLVTNLIETFCWQTNGMANAWWTTNVLQFTPSMDVGATSYTCFIRAAGSNGVSYRANGIITMRHGPGFTPNTLPLPVPSIDFASVTYLNAPWLISGATGIRSIALGNYASAAGNYGATAIGNNVTASGDRGSTALGASTTASGSDGATALGLSTVASGVNGATALGRNSIASGGCGATALGYNSIASNTAAYVWSQSYNPYGSHGDGTFNINPAGGMAGIWIGETTLAATLASKPSTADVEAIAAAIATTKLYSPASSTQWIDGDGNKYVVSNRWEMTFSDDFGNSYEETPSNESYIFNSLEVISEGDWDLGFGEYMGTNGWYVSYDIEGMSGENSWTATTNQYVLDPSYGANGTVFINPYATTSLVSRLATEAFVGNATNGLVGDSITNGLVGASITNGLVGASITNGILSAAISADTTAKGVSANTATNAISATSPGTDRIRLTATALAATVPPASATYLAVQSGSSVGTQSVVSVSIGTNLNYAAAFDSTNTVLTESGGQMINYILYLNETETGDQTARVEFFNHYTATNLWGPWGIIGPTFTVPSTATPSMVSGAVFVSAISTNAFSLGMRIRRVAGTAASSCLLKIGTGPGYDSRLSISLPTYFHDADPAAHANMSRTSMLWTAAGTNASYQMTWDITNGTFKVLEILP